MGESGCFRAGEEMNSATVVVAALFSFEARLHRKGDDDSLRPPAPPAPVIFTGDGCLV